MVDFLISYTAADQAWAEWIAWVLEEARFKVIVQKWDFAAGSNFVLEMQKAAAAAKRTIAVLSPDYLKSHFGAPEWAAALAQDPEGMERKLVPVRIRECDPAGLLKAIVYIDLVDLGEEAAQQQLLRRLTSGRGKPAAKPAFPGAKGPAPAFPGAAPSRKPASAATARRIPKIGSAITDRDRRIFMKEAFGVIRTHFEQNLAELERDNAGVETDLTPVDATRFTAEIFVHGKSRARCKIWQGGMLGGDSISYAEGSTADHDNASNEILTLARGESELALSATLNMGFGRADDGLDVNHLSPDDAGEYLWRRFTWALD